MQKLRIFLLGAIVPGQTEIQWHIAPLPVESEPVDGDLQRLIDEGEQTQELIDAREDDLWHSRGQW